MEIVLINRSTGYMYIMSLKLVIWVIITVSVYLQCFCDSVTTCIKKKPV
jgi:hypothetical protein